MQNRKQKPVCTDQYMTSWEVVSSQMAAIVWDPALSSGGTTARPVTYCDS